MEEYKKDSLGLDEKIAGFLSKAEKLKKHLSVKVQLIRYLYI